MHVSLLKMMQRIIIIKRIKNNDMKTHQAAVDWLKDKLKETYDKEGKLPLAYTLHLVEQAKEIEKEQRIRDYNVGYLDAKCNHVQDAESYLVEQEYLASKSAI